MSESGAAKSPDLAGLLRSSDASDHGANGIDHRHVAGAERVVDIARRFEDAGYALEMITCTDLRFLEDGEPAFRLSYTYNRFMPGAHDRHLVVADLAPEVGVEAPSVTDVYPAADWFEREVYDLYGVRFAGHPDLKRILLPDDSDFHALLKDFGRIEDAEDADGEGEDDA